MLGFEKLEGAVKVDFSPILLGVVILLAVALLVICIARKVRLAPVPFWVLTGALCLASVSLAILGHETGVLVCLLLAAVAFFVGCIGAIGKK